MSQPEIETDNETENETESGVYVVENESHFLRNAAIGLLAIGILGWGIWNWNDSQPSSASTPGTASRLAADLDISLSTPTLESRETASPTATPSATPVSGRADPYTEVFYPSVTAPAGFEDWDCFGIPAGGTSWGAILVGGESIRTRYDSTSAVVFVEPPVEIDPQTSPDTWNPRSRAVQPSTVVCSR